MFENRPRPRWRVAIRLHHAPLGSAQHELGVTLIDRVIVDVKAVHLGGYRGCVRDRAPPTIDDLPDWNLVPI